MTNNFERLQKFLNKRICPACHEPFIPHKINQVYCSEMCYLQAKYEREKQKCKNKTHNSIFEGNASKSINIISNHIPFSSY